MYTDQFARASGLLTAGVTFNHTGRLVGTGPEALQALELASVMRLDLTRLLNTQPWIDRPSVLMSMVAADDRTASQELQRFACWCARRLLPLLPVEPIRFDEMISLYEQNAEGGGSMQDLLFAQESLQSTDRVLSVVQALTQHQSPNRVVEAINIISDDLAWGFRRQAMNAGHSEVEAIKIAQEKVGALGFGLDTLQAELIRRAIMIWEARLG